MPKWLRDVFSWTISKNIYFATFLLLWISKLCLDTLRLKDEHFLKATLLINLGHLFKSTFRFFAVNQSQRLAGFPFVLSELTLSLKIKLLVIFLKCLLLTFLNCPGDWELYTLDNHALSFCHVILFTYSDRFWRYDILNMLFCHYNDTYFYDGNKA